MTFFGLVQQTTTTLLDFDGIVVDSNDQTDAWSRIKHNFPTKSLQRSLFGNAITFQVKINIANGVSRET